MRYVLCLLFLLLTPVASAAEKADIGLVLSGGAARGLAHIGVLKALEEQGIHVDAIAGTSMGAVVGGLYAAGYSAKDLEHIAQQMDWQQVLSDQPPRKDVPFRRKQDDRDFLVKQKLSFRDDGTLGLPIGVIQGQNLGMMLEKLFVQTSATTDFDRLTIPFRAVATDITTGDKVVFSHGHLPRVIRASMSIPAVFAPVELDGRLLVDGGMVDNIPVDVARSMGARHLIVVDIGTPLLKRKELTTVVDVLNQSTTLMTRANSQAQLATLGSQDLLIQPPLASYTSTDFADAQAIIDAGYRATMAMAGELARLRDDHGGTAQVRPSLLGQQASAPPIITAIRVENESKVDDAVIRHYIRQKLNQPLNIDRLQDDMSTLYGLDYFDQVEYRVRPEGHGANELIIHARGKRSGTDYLRLGLNLSDDLRGDSAFNFGASYRVNGINRLGGEWLTRAQIGDQQELYSEFYQPLDVGSRYFIAPYLSGEARNIEQLEGSHTVAEYRRERYGFGLYMGRQVGNSGEIRWGVGRDWGTTEVHVGPEDTPELSFKEGFYELSYSFDDMNDVNFPRQGQDLSLTLKQFDPSLGSDSRYRQAELRLNKAISLGYNTLILGGGLGRTLTTNSDTDVVTSSFLLGGALQLSGFRQDALSGQNYGLARLIYFRQLTQRSLFPLDSPLYVGGSLEQGRIWNQDDSYDSGTITAASVFLGLDTPLGPLKFSYGLNDQAQRAFYINLGSNF